MNRAESNSWRRVKLKEVCEKITVGHVGPMVNEYVDSGVPFLRSQNIQPFKLDIAEMKHITPEFHKKLSKSALHPGDVAIVRTGYPGTAAVIPKRFTELNCADLVIARPTSHLLDPWYLTCIFNSTWGRGAVAGNLVGVAQQHFNVTAAKEMEVLLPDLPTQRRIASILSAYDDLIENNTRRIAILEEMARKIYEEWFVHFRFPGCEQVKMVESELGLIPEGWSILPLQDIATVTMGLSPKGESYNTNGDGIPLINGPVEFGDRFTMCVKWTTAPTKLCSAGDFIICVRGSTTGKYVKSDGVYCLGRGVCAIKSTWQCFVDQMFIHQLPILLAQTGGSTFPSWTGPQLKQHPVLLPSIELLSRFESLVQPMNATVLNYSRKNANLRATRDLLLPKLISGELDVSSLPEPEEVITA